MIESVPKILTTTQIQIIKAVLYFDVFRYPLLEHELYQNSAIEIPYSEFLAELNALVEGNLLIKEGAFILSTERTSNDITQRLKGNLGATSIMPVALAYSKRIAAFPFVEGVFLSGALSKNFYDENGDIDFFIVAKPNRLWLCRTILILRYKMLPKHLKKYWCVNYFIASDHLKLPDVNAFTATELAYLLPTVNHPLYKKILQENEWYKSYYPNKQTELADNCIEPSTNKIKLFVEFVFSAWIGRMADQFLFKITLWHWKRKYPELSTEDFELQFRSQKHVCKRHTKGFQNKVLQVWAEKQKQFEEQFRLFLRKTAQVH